MNEKKQSGKKRLFLLVLVAFGIVLWITFTNLNRIALRHTLDETIGFVKIRLEQYETDAANDRVKSLVRLLDKTVSLGNEMTLKEGFGTQDLDAHLNAMRKYNYTRTITMEMANGSYMLDPEPHYRANIETLRAHFDGGELV